MCLGKYGRAMCILKALIEFFPDISTGIFTGPVLRLILHAWVILLMKYIRREMMTTYNEVAVLYLMTLNNGTKLP